MNIHEVVYYPTLQVTWKDKIEWIEFSVNDLCKYGFLYKTFACKFQQCIRAVAEFKGALDNIWKFSFWLNFIDHVKIDC